MYSRFTTFILIITVTCVTGQPTRFTCPSDGYFMDSQQCDKFYYCYKGVAEEKLCPDGLVFDTTSAPRIGQCNYPFLAYACPEGSTYQPAQPRGVCPRLNGYFVHEEPSVCHKYYQCTNGSPIKRTCSKGLVFDPVSGKCLWARSKARTGCSEKEPESLNGFFCPKKPQLSYYGQRMDHARFLKEDDCRSFYVCVDGTRPVLHGCPEGLVFNDVTLNCDDPLYVPGCENYYASNFLYDYAPEETNVDNNDEINANSIPQIHGNQQIPEVRSTEAIPETTETHQNSERF